MLGQLDSRIVKKFMNTPQVRLFVDAIPNAILMINNKQQVMFANREFQELCFTKVCEVTPYDDVIPHIKSDLSEIKDIITSVYARPTALSQELSIGNEIYTCEVNPVMDGEKLHGCIISLNEITEIALEERQHELLYQMTSAFAELRDAPSILRIAVSQIARAMNTKSVNIMLYDRTTKELQVRVGTHAPADGKGTRSFKLGEGVAGRVAQERVPYAIPNIATSELYAKKRKTDTGALLVAPIYNKGNLLGIINVAHRQPRTFSEREVQFLTIIANTIAVALENSQLYRKLNKKIEQLSKLFTISSFVGTHRLDHRLNQIVKTIPTLLEAEQSCIYLSDKTFSTLTFAYGQDKDTHFPTEIVLSKNAGARSSLLEQKTLILSDDEIINLFPELVKLHPEMRSLLATPIWVNEKPIGVLFAVNKLVDEFTDDDRNLAQITAHRLGTKIETSRLVRNVQSEKELLDKIIENTSEGVAVIDKNQRIIIWNRYLEELTGLNSNQLIGLPYSKVFNAQLKLKRLTQSLQHIGTFRGPYYLEEQMMSSTQGLVWVGIIHSSVLDLHNEPENTILVFRNITKDKELMEAKNEFLSLTTHELRTPLTAIKGYLSMIMQGDAGEITPRQQLFFSKAMQATNRLVGLVEEILSVIRIEENRVTFQFQLFSIKELVTECAEEFRLSAAQKKITITHSGTDISAWGDRIKTKQIITNLIENAIKYTRDKGIIDLTYNRRNHQACITVRDSGVGIAPKHIPTIFDKFVRIDNPLSIKAGGTGLGLYIVKNLVEKQGGRIWVESELRKGSTFIVTLPMRAPQNTLPQQSQERSFA